jgi:integrase/recombinase XerD
MNKPFDGPLAVELSDFLRFKRSLGYGYMRGEFTLREFDRFLIGYATSNRHWHLQEAALEWLSSKPDRKPVSVSGDAAVLRQFYRYLHRSCNPRAAVEPIWPRLPTESSFVPYVLAEKDILNLLMLSAALNRPQFRATLYRAMILVLYCTGIRFGEALRLRMRDVDTRAAILFVDTFKGRARWVPFHRSLARELNPYIAARVAYAPSGPDTLFFVGANQRRLPLVTAGNTFRHLFKLAGLKPETGRNGPRPYDLRQNAESGKMPNGALTIYRKPFEYRSRAIS